MPVVECPECGYVFKKVKDDFIGKKSPLCPLPSILYRPAGPSGSGSNGSQVQPLRTDVPLTERAVCGQKGALQPLWTFFHGAGCFTA